MAFKPKKKGDEEAGPKVPFWDKAKLKQRGAKKPPTKKK